MGKQRGRDEGSIVQRHNGLWEAKISLGYEGGKRIRKSFYGTTRKDVKEKLTKALRAHEQGLKVQTDERKTMTVFLADWLETVVKPSKRPKTYASYAQIVKLHLEPGLGRITVAKLTAQDVQRFLNRKSNEVTVRKVRSVQPLPAGSPRGTKPEVKLVEVESKLSPRTVQYLREVLRNALGQAVKWDLCPRNVALLVSPPQVGRREMTSLNPEQAGEFLKAARGNRYEALFSVALAVGLRIGEGLGLRWSDIDLVAGTLTVNNQLQRIGGVPMLVAPKTRRGTRTVVLPQFAVQALAAHRKRQQDEDRPAARDKWQETGFVFTTEIGTPLDDANVRRTLRKLLKDAKLPALRFHDLRHTCASLLLAQKVPARVVMEILGHSQVALTLNTYSHVLPVLEHEAASLMDGLLSKAQGA